MLVFLCKSVSGEAKVVFLIYFGLISFGVSIAFAILIMMVNGFRINKYIKKHHYNAWSIPNGTSFKKSAEYGKAIKSINDPILKEKSKRGDKYSKLCLTIWFVLFLLVGIIILFLHILGV